MTAHPLFVAASKAFDAPVETERLIVKPWRKEDANVLSDFFAADNGDYPQKWMKWPADYDYPPSYIPDIIDHNYRQGVVDGTFLLALQNKTSGQIIGEMRFYADLLGRTRLPFYILPSQRRQGYGEEGYKAIFQRAVQSTIFTGNAVHAEVEMVNHASRAFLKKIGFQDTGTVLSQCQDYEGQSVTGFKCALTPIPVKPYHKPAP